MNKMTFQEIGQWMSHYYQDPCQVYVPQVIEGLSNEHKLGDENTALPIMYFLSFIFRANPDKIEVWTSSFIDKLPIIEKQVLIMSLWLSNTQNAKHYLNFLANSIPELFEYINELTSSTLPDLEEIPIDRPDIIDALWAAFMATGEKKYVLRIISSLTNCDDKVGDIKQLIGNTAKWSLKSNAMNHSQVKAICISQLNHQPPKVATILQNIIEELDDKKSNKKPLIKNIRH